jgi:hypothetical protein
MAGHGFGRYGLLPGHAIATSDRLEQIQHGLQFSLWIPLQNIEYIRACCCGLSELGPHGARNA